MKNEWEIEKNKRKKEKKKDNEESQKEKGKREERLFLMTLFYSLFQVIFYWPVSVLQTQAAPKAYHIIF